MEDNSEKNEKVERVLREPVFCGFDEIGHKVKNHLLLFSVISIFIVLGELHIQEDSSILGLKFTGLNDFILYFGLLVIQIYLLVHFIWRCFDTFFEWTLRVTGTKVAYQTGSFAGSEEADYPSNPRQSTLYNWWMYNASRIGNLADKKNVLSELIKQHINRTEEWLEHEDKSNMNPNVVSMLGKIITENNNLITEIHKLNNSINQVEKTIKSTRITVSLKRFDKRFYYFLRSQNLRWLIVDFIIPSSLGLYSILLLSTALYFT